MIKSETVMIKWNPRIKKHYTMLGYSYTKMGDEFEVKVEDLTKGSNVYVDLVCDYCTKTFPRAWYHHVKQKENDMKKGLQDCDCCDDCKNIKVEESNIINYGSKNVMSNEEVYNKYVKSIQAKFGVSNNFERLEVKEHIKDYWESNPEEFKERNEKIINTTLEKYGVENIFQSEETKVKIKATLINKYGVDNPMKNEEIKFASLKTRAITTYENGTKVSTQQKHINELLGWELNYPIDNVNLDCANVDSKIYLEYNGSGHWLSVEIGNVSLEDFNRKEMQRQYFLNKKGWKLIRLNSKKDMLPNDNELLEVIIECINYLNNGHSWIEINIDDNKLICSQFEKDLKFNSLKRMYKQKEVV